MSERRQQPRSRVYYGGTVAFNDRNSTLACLVRNFSRLGARIEFEDAALVPDEVDFEIERKGIYCSARMIWRDRFAAGLMFLGVNDSSVIPLDWARKLRASERTNRRLQARLDQLRSEY
jgi:hypothetical protein